MKALAILVVWLFSGVAAQTPTRQPAPSPLDDDPAIQEILMRARRSDQPQLVVLAQRISGLIADRNTGDPKDFKLGALAVLRHCDSSKDFRHREAYLRLLQTPVEQEIYAVLNAAESFVVDGSAKDWPRETISSFPKPDKASKKKDERVLSGFGAMRGNETLMAIFKTADDPVLDPARSVYTIEISKLDSQFGSIDYTVSITGKHVRIFDSEGEEILREESQMIYMKTGTRAVEVSIPVVRFEENLRSLSARGYVVDRKNKITHPKSSWIACPTGPVSDPLEMLIHFATQQELPAGNTLPVMIALQEGLLLSRSDAALSTQIRDDAFAWMQLALDIDERTELTATAQPRNLPIAAQAAWACRYDGAATLKSAEEYAFAVPTPKTMADMRGYAEVQGWLTLESTSESLNKVISALLAASFEHHDYPNQAARTQGHEFVDPDAKAYYANAEQKLLSYREVGINERWRYFENGFGLKGDWRQAVEFQRLLSIAVGLPSVWAYQAETGQVKHLTVNFDGKRNRWMLLGAATPQVSERDKVYFAFGRPWTRPERFDFWEHPFPKIPEGQPRLLLNGGLEEYPARRLNTIIEKGLSSEQFDKRLLHKIRLR